MITHDDDENIKEKKIITRLDDIKMIANRGGYERLCLFDFVQRGEAELLSSWILMHDVRHRWIGSYHPKNGRTLLHEAVLCGNFDMVKLLLDYNVGVNSKTLLGRVTPLHMACQRGDILIVRLLIREGAKLYLRNKLGEQAIHLASTPEVTEFLLRRGANPFSKTSQGLTPSQIAARDGLSDIYDMLQDEIEKTQRREQRAIEQLQAKRQSAVAKIETTRDTKTKQKEKQKALADYMKWRTGNAS